MAYARLRKHLELPDKPIRVYDPVQQLAIVDEDLLQRFGVDTIELGRAFAREEKYWSEWVLPDGTPCFMPAWALPQKDDGEWVLKSSRTHKVLARMPQGVWYFEQCSWPFLEQEDLSHLEAEMSETMWTAIASPPGPIAAGVEGGKVLAEGARKLRQETDRAIIGLFGGNLLECGQFLYRNDNFLMLLAGEPDRAHRFLDKLMELHLRNLDRFLTLVGVNIDIILFGDDLGMQSGPQVSPAMHREFFKPRERQMWQIVKKRMPHLKIQLHCCGGVRELLPDLIDAGLDAINPVQITCRGMDAAGLKHDFGDKLAFWGGGCDTRDMLIKGTPQQVRDHVRRQMEIWRPGGGYVFQQVHNILADIPAANLVAMLDAVNEG
jgi:uroporphyrinogen decarboxylase